MEGDGQIGVKVYHSKSKKP